MVVCCGMSVNDDQSVFALIDCRDFYASCERVFDPRLLRRPVIVLSNNDGCVISRSGEAKQLGVTMGAPYFQIGDLIDAGQIKVFSSNYELYGDMSRRVMQTLESFTPEVETYSIDEAFVNLNGCRPRDLHELGHEMRQRVERWTGLPVRVGIGPTKTLAKLANFIAKKSTKADGVVNLYASPYVECALERVSIGDVWGIGPAYTKMLKAAGIETARALRDAPDAWIRRRMGIVGLRTVHELRGISCLPLESCPRPRKSVTVSRSFGRLIADRAEMKDAVAYFASRAAVKLRRDGLAASVMMVFASTNRFSNDPQDAGSTVIHLPVPTNYTPELIGYAREAAGKVFRDGYRYKKAGVFLTELVPVSPIQSGLFDRLDRERARSLMKALDEINLRFGRNTVKYGAVGLQQPWQTNSNWRSPRYTTCWKEIPALSPL